MFAAKAFAIASFVLAGAKALSVSTPENVAQCGDTHITISGATGQYHVSVVPSVDPCSHDALFESSALTGDSYTWKTNLPAGTQAMIVVDDDAGNEAWSAPFTVGGGDASCLNGSPSSSSDSSTSSTSSSTSSAYTPESTTTQPNVVVNNVPASASASASSSHSVDAPANAQENTPAAGAAVSNTHTSLFTILVAMGVVTMAL